MKNSVKFCLLLCLMVGWGLTKSNWESEVIDSGTDPAITVEPEGIVHLCYTNNNNACYATNQNGRWQTEIVASNARAWDLVFSDGKLHYCYSVYDSESEVYSLYYTFKDVTSSNWSTAQKVTDASIGIWSVTMSVDPSGSVHLLFIDSYGAASNGNMIYCVQSAQGWSIETIGEAYDHAALAADRNGLAHIIFYSMSMGMAAYLTNAPNGNWQEVEGIEPVGGQLEGMECDIDTDRENFSHASYVSGEDEDYKYGKRTDQWQISLLEPGSYQSAGNAIAVDKNNGAHVVYFHVGSGILQYKLIQSNSISGSAIAEAGWNNDIAVDSTIRAHVVYQNNDDQIVYVKESSSFVNDQSFQPFDFQLYRNFPNPFNSSTRLAFSLTKPAFVRLMIIDVQGRLVRILKNQVVPAGHHWLIWEGKDQKGQNVPSGIYFCVLQSKQKTLSQRLLLVR